MHFNSEGEFSKDVLDAIYAFKQSRNLPTQDFQKSPLWSEKLKAGQYEVKPESVCNCTLTERAFLDEIQAKFQVCDDGSLGLKSGDYSSAIAMFVLDGRKP